MDTELLNVSRQRFTAQRFTSASQVVDLRSAKGEIALSLDLATADYEDLANSARVELWVARDGKDYGTSPVLLIDWQSHGRVIGKNGVVNPPIVNTLSLNEPLPTETRAYIVIDVPQTVRSGVKVITRPIVD